MKSLSSDEVRTGYIYCATEYALERWKIYS